MRLRELICGTAFMSFALITAAAAPMPDNCSVAGIGDAVWPTATADTRPPTEAPASVPAVTAAVSSLPSAIINEDRAIGSAYYDALSILMDRNPCSDFFGGSSLSLEVFNSLARRLKKDYYPVSVGMRMSGSITTVENARTKAAYRLFDKVSINANGPFYRSTSSRSEPTIPRIGKFRPSSREVRVLMLLHELGHLVKGVEGNWLLPDDGNDVEASSNNSRKIEDVCGDQIRELAKSSTSKKHLKQAEPQEAVARTNTSPEPNH